MNFLDIVQRLVENEHLVNESMGYKPVNSISEIWQEASEKGFFSAVGPDADLRGPFVGFQACVEHAMTDSLRGLRTNFGPDESRTGKKSIYLGKITIHTPKPATPILLMNADPMKSSLISQDIKGDPVRLKTVTDRISLVREFMEAGGFVELAFPKSFDWSTLGSAERESFDAAMKEFGPKGSKALSVRPLDCAVPSDLVGASADIWSGGDCRRFFSLQATQADKPSTDMQWTVWFGERISGKSAVDQRYKAVSQFLNQNGQVDPGFAVPQLG